MAAIEGAVVVTGTIAPTDTLDVYPTIDPKYGVDGLRNVVDSTERNNIPYERQRLGMLVGTQNDGKYWKLIALGTRVMGPTFGTDDVDWEEFSSGESGGGIIDILYEDLVLLAESTQGLTPGQLYCITDYQTVHFMLDNIFATSDINSGSTEPLIVFATGINSLDHRAYSELYPNDIIYYSLLGTEYTDDVAFFDGTSVNPVTGFKGIIYFRHDTVKDVSAWYDFRNVKFRRWGVDCEFWQYTSYTKGDLAKGNDGNIYICKVDHVSQMGDLNPDSDSAKWQLWLDLSLFQNWSWTSTISYFDIGNARTDNLIIKIEIYEDYYTFVDYANVSNFQIGKTQSITILNNMVFDVDDAFNVSFGRNCYNCTFYSAYSEKNSGATIGVDFHNNAINVSFFRHNIIKDLFSYNSIMGDSTVSGFSGNIIENSFSYNTIGDNFAYNLIGDNFTYNLIGIGFYSNSIGIGFSENTIETYFQSNIIGNIFNNNIIETYFTDNTISNIFQENTIGDRFISNTVEINFYNNIIGADFFDNSIGLEFQSNTIGDNFMNNTIGNYFEYNIIGAYFGYDQNSVKALGNRIRDMFQYNIIGHNVFSNVIGNDCHNNQIGLITFRYSSLAGGTFAPGETVQNGNGQTAVIVSDNGTNIMTIDICIYGSFTVGDTLDNGAGITAVLDVIEYEIVMMYSNNIGDTFESNTIGYEFCDNVIGNYFVENTIGDYFYSNLISNTVNTNIIGSDFSHNTIKDMFYGNTVGNNFEYNLIGSYTQGNIIGNNFKYNTTITLFNSNVIGNNFRWNNIKCLTVSTDFSASTYVYGDYNCELYMRSDQTTRLKFYNGDDELEFYDIAE